LTVRRWTAHHEDWGKEVASLAVDTSDGLVFFDPIDPPGNADHTFITTFFHARDARGRVWAPKSLVRRLENRGVEVTDPFELGDTLPAGIQAFDTARDGEVLYWVPSEQLLVVGDVLLGSPLRLCPKSWLGKATHDDLKAALRPLVTLPVVGIHVGHGEGVFEDGRAALADLL